MFHRFVRRILPRLAARRDWVPLAILLAALASLFALGGDRGYFYRLDFHDFSSSKTLAISELLSPKHGFLLMPLVWRDEDGGFEYGLYNRFPMGGYVLIKLATLPFGSDLAAKLFAARLLMLAMFCGAALFAYLALARVVGNRWIALAAVSLAFSSFYALRWADAVFNECVMDLFGSALVFHGMVEFSAAEGRRRFRQLLVKTCAALLLGWHVYALILPFALLMFGGDAVAAMRSALSSGGGFGAARAAVGSLARSRAVVLAVVSIAVGASLLGFNFANEYSVYGGNRAFSELPSVHSMMSRLGQTDTYRAAPGTEWGSFMRQQLYRVGVMSAPYALVRATGSDFPTYTFQPPLAPAIWGAAATCAALAGLALFRRRYRIPMAAVVLFGFCWALPFRHTAYYPPHSYESIFYIGLALALFGAAFAAFRRALDKRGGFGAAIPAAAVLAALAFALSVFLAGQARRDADRTELEKAMLADFNAMADTIRGKRVLLVSHPSEWGDDGEFRRHPPYFYLSGSYWRNAYGCESEPPGAADFAVSRHHHEGLNSLTPENSVAFLYRMTDPLEFCRAERRLLESSEPAARSEFDVHFQEYANALRYHKAPCAPEDYEAPFFVYAYSMDANDLPAEFKESGFQAFSPAQFHERAVFDGACVMTLYLPFPTLRVRTGQYISGGERLWDVSLLMSSGENPALLEKAYQAISSGEPAARSGFDLYLDGGALHYLKEPCSEDDADGRFFLSVHPVDAGDLPPDRRELGHESLNFDFAQYGAAFGGKCMITRQLPDYPIERIETGQDAPSGERLWDAMIEAGIRQR